MILSICIPTYNRLESLKECLESILISKKELKNNKNFEVCISDNCSSKSPLKIIKRYKKHLNIKYQRNKKNLGYGLNYLKSISMAQGEFVWTLGDDDFLLPYSLKNLFKIIYENKFSDFFFINSYNATNKFKAKILKKKSFIYFEKKFSSKASYFNQNYRCNFFQLIHPKISFDFLLGITFCVFRKKNWDDNIQVIDRKLIKDKRVWSNFDNTCPHNKVFAKAFNSSEAFYFKKPLSINTAWERSWKDLYKFVEIVRIPEILDCYRKNGLSFINYLNCKNYSLRNFLNYFFYILINRKKSGFKYFNFYKHFVRNMIFPNFYLSIIYFIFRKSKSCFKSLNWSL